MQQLQAGEPMPKSVSASEAKNRLGSLIAWATSRQDEVIIESRGKPKAVIMSFDEYQKLGKLKEQARRQDALARLEGLRETVSKRSQDLKGKQVVDAADRFARDVIDEMVQEDKITYQNE